MYYSIYTNIRKDVCTNLVHQTVEFAFRIFISFAFLSIASTGGNTMKGKKAIEDIVGGFRSELMYISDVCEHSKRLHTIKIGQLLKWL